MEEKKINNLEIKVFKSKNDNKKILHKELINLPYFCLFCCAKKNSGKSNIIANIVFLSAIPKFTIIRLFSTTAYTDLTTKSFLKKCDKYKVEYEIYDDILDNEGNDILEKQFNEVQNQVLDLEEEYENSKVHAPLYIYIFDDISAILRKKSLEQYIKRHRHLKTIFIISSQYYYDISPSIRANINLIFLFQDLSLKVLQEIYNEKINSRELDFNKFLDIYDKTTNEQYSFLYINVDNLEFRKKLQYKILV